MPFNTYIPNKNTTVKTALISAFIFSVGYVALPSKEVQQAPTEDEEIKKQILTIIARLDQSLANQKSLNSLHREEVKTVQNMIYNLSASYQWQVSHSEAAGYYHTNLFQMSDNNDCTLTPVTKLDDIPESAICLLEDVYNSRLPTINCIKPEDAYARFMDQSFELEKIKRTYNQLATQSQGDFAVDFNALAIEAERAQKVQELSFSQLVHDANLERFTPKTCNIS